LKDGKGGVVAVLADEGLGIRSLPVGARGKLEAIAQTYEASVGEIAPVVKPGDCDVSVGRRDGTPGIALPLPDDDGQRRYRTGRIAVR
jgi:hypothetical protein